MAQINLKNIKKIKKNRNIIHDKVYTTYTVFNADGDRYVQIDTYGKIDRENPDKIFVNNRNEDFFMSPESLQLKKEFEIK